MSDKPAKKPAWGWVAIALAVGMLIWVRLRLVTDIPRSAYAEPEARESVAAPRDSRPLGADQPRHASAATDLERQADGANAR